MTNYLPDYLFESPIFSQIFNAGMSEFELLALATADAEAQCFVASATWGLKYWEQFLGLVVDEAKSVEKRRELITASIRGTGTVTKQMLEVVCASFSNGTVQITEDASTSSMVIAFSDIAGIPTNMADITAMVETVIPAHLVYTYAYLYNTYAMLSTHTYAELEAYTYAELFYRKLD